MYSQESKCDAVVSATSGRTQNQGYKDLGASQTAIQSRVSNAYAAKPKV